MTHLKKIAAGSVVALIAGFAISAHAVLIVDCDKSEIVGGVGSGGVYTPSAGAGWDVGSGQCNGDFTTSSNPSFPGGALELGMRAEQRSAGQVLPPAHTGTDYEVQAGADTTAPAANRAWWNFQQSIAYDGNIADLDALTFAIRTDAGTSVPVRPVDMNALRGLIDARYIPKATTAYSDIYQTSQNPVFSWFTTYSLGQTGAWRLTLAAAKDGALADVSICIHTPGEACLAAPVVYTCSAFEPPIAAKEAYLLLKKQNRVLPLKMVCKDSQGTVMTPAEISAPKLKVTFTDGVQPPDDVSNDILPAGQGTEGNEFVYSGGNWSFNLQTKPYTAMGTYTVGVQSTGGHLLVGSPSATFIRQ